MDSSFRFVWPACRWSFTGTGLTWSPPGTPALSSPESLKRSISVMDGADMGASFLHLGTHNCMSASGRCCTHIRGHSCGHTYTHTCTHMCLYTCTHRCGYVCVHTQRHECAGRDRPLRDDGFRRIAASSRHDHPSPNVSLNRHSLADALEGRADGFLSPRRSTDRWWMGTDRQLRRCPSSTIHSHSGQVHTLFYPHLKQIS